MFSVLGPMLKVTPQSKTRISFHRPGMSSPHLIVDNFIGRTRRASRARAGGRV